MKNSVFLSIVVLMIMGCSQSKLSDYHVAGVSRPVISLNGTWHINPDPPDEYWKQKIINKGWKTIQVPGEAMMQGFPIEHDQPFAYKKQIEIPADYEGKRILLRFDGVYSYARVWVNGQYVRDHHGGFTRWECDLTPFAEPGEKALLTVEVTDRSDQISYASGYAKHPIGGILRDVNLMAMPQNCPDEVKIETDLDDNYRHAMLIVSGKMNRDPDQGEIRISLYNEAGDKISLDDESLEIKDKRFNIENQIENPVKWDAEHPNLYSLYLSYFEEEELKWQKEYRVGFREIERKGNQLLVNGKPVKLRGANRHDIHPLLGRVSAPEYERKDVVLAKEANMNFIRTSHYPPTENFLELCDQHGIYVESETAVCFVGTHRMGTYKPGDSQDSLAFRDRYLKQMQEMVKDHMNHPSVILWSTGNESSFGSNFKDCYDWVKQYDPTRPVIFSYPGNVPDSVRAYDILSMHYPGISGNMNQRGIVTRSFGHEEMPVLFDEWAHVPCYNKSTVKEDPNVRNFWGRSLDTMWTGVYKADGGLGGAIWGMIDETFMLPLDLSNAQKWLDRADPTLIPGEFAGKTIGYGEWGIIDTWRRKKPEFWNTKKAYSPVKILRTRIKNYVEGEPISLPVYNRFDHTNLNELEIKQTYKKEEKRLESPDIEPGNRGLITLDIDDWNGSEPVILEILRNNRLIDKYAIRLTSEEESAEKDIARGNIRVEETNSRLTIVCGDNTRITFDKNTGLLSEIQNSAEGAFPLIGPYINLRTKGETGTYYSNNRINTYCNDWKLKEFNYRKKSKLVSVNIKGEYDGDFPVAYKILVDSDGSISIQYQLENIPREYIREMGIKFKLTDEVDSLLWERDAYWSIYPENHLSSRKGKAPLYAGEQKIYRREPDKPWNMDAKSFFYHGTEDEKIDEQLTHIAKSTKEQIRRYSLLRDDREVFSVRGKTDVNCRLARTNGELMLFANNRSDYVNLSWGNYQRNILPDERFTDSIMLK